ncbi:hypothetical protein AB0P12_24690, partial [Streptomyces subrutilus]|uniref:hypothetical protein n=1 Tax=Streptomyces subrutilus TaxID=36818 RepID=UPI00341A8570
HAAVPDGRGAGVQEPHPGLRAGGGPGARRAAGATTVFLAGKPGTAAEAVDAYVYAGCDAVAVLSRVLDRMGVTS